MGRRTFLSLIAILFPGRAVAERPPMPVGPPVRPPMPVGPPVVKPVDEPATTIIVNPLAVPGCANGNCPTVSDRRIFRRR